MVSSSILELIDRTNVLRAENDIIENNDVNIYKRVVHLVRVEMHKETSRAELPQRQLDYIRERAYPRVALPSDEVLKKTSTSVADNTRAC